MAIDLDNINLHTARSTVLPWLNVETNNDTGEIKIFPPNDFNPALFHDWCVKNLNSDQIKKFTQAKNAIAELEQEAIVDGDLVVTEDGTNIWADLESFSIIHTLVDPDLMIVYYKINYQYAKDKGVID